ncbi:hypothetical protein BJ322DRAFT_484964 [Thelephora terrestris]|uniref:Uncharacterized protein n=1 Tax=Thelephora terrestris TaxID=56493 RepID=A0A9P6L1L2_9AGAM|nr:hypothetical protein BJ322DRAFT_484964 [Thelephora terrestris]
MYKIYELDSTTTYPPPNMSLMSANTIYEEPRSNPYNPKGSDTQIPEMPSYWSFKGDELPSDKGYSYWWSLLHSVHQFFCVISLGHGSLRDVWKVSHPECPDEVWEKGRNELRERLNNINVVAGLLLSAMVGFCTTDPPGGARILPYTNTGPYCVLLTSIGLSLGGLIVGSATAFVIHKSRAEWFRETMMGSHRRIWATTVLLAFPFLSIGAATCTAASGLLIAASYSEVTLVRVACYVLVVPPMTCALVFGWMMAIKTGALKESVRALKESVKSVNLILARTCRHS